MPTPARNTRCTVIPCLRYRNAAGGRDFTCRDPEGHVWTFGSYDPW
jgi:hypothetical protein